MADKTPITIKEVRDQHASLQKRGLNWAGASKQVVKMLTGRVVLMEDGEEVAIGDVEFTQPEKAEDEQMDDEGEELKAEDGEEDDDEKMEDEDDEEDMKSAIAASVKAEVNRRMKGVKATGRRQPPPASQKLIIPATVKRFSTKNFQGETRHPQTGDVMSAELRAYRFGMWALNNISKSIPVLSDAFPNARKYCDQHGLSLKLHQGNVNTTGGYLVPEEFGTDLIDLREQYGVARRVLKIRPMVSDTRTDPRRTGGLTASFVAEGAAGTESTKSWDQVRLTAKDLMVLSRYTNQLSEDAVINIGDDLAGEISYAFAEKEDQCAFNGDGTSTYGGIRGIRNRLFNPGGTMSAGLFEQGTGTTWGAIVLGDFDSVVGLLPQYADTANAVWIMHRTFYYTVVEKLVQASGGVPAYEVREGNRKPRPLFKGYPVEFSQVYPSATATESVVCTLGDHSLGASFGDRQQDAIAFSEHATIGGESVFERNEIAIRGTERFDINVHDVGDANSVGPIVGLVTDDS